MLITCLLIFFLVYLSLYPTEQPFEDVLSSFTARGWNCKPMEGNTCSDTVIWQIPRKKEKSYPSGY